MKFSFNVESEMVAQELPLAASETPIVFTNRTRGYSKISKRVIIEAFVYVGKLFFKRFNRLGSFANSTNL